MLSRDAVTGCCYGMLSRDALLWGRLPARLSTARRQPARPQPAERDRCRAAAVTSVSGVSRRDHRRGGVCSEGPCGHADARCPPDRRRDTVAGEVAQSVRRLAHGTHPPTGMEPCHAPTAHRVTPCLGAPHLRAWPAICTQPPLTTSRPLPRRDPSTAETGASKYQFVGAVNWVVNHPESVRWVVHHAQQC